MGNPLNGDFKGWEDKKAPADGTYVLVANHDSKINIARFEAGWFDRKGKKLEDVCCSMTPPDL